MRRLVVGLAVAVMLGMPGTALALAAGPVQPQGAAGSQALSPAMQSCYGTALQQDNGHLTLAHAETCAPGATLTPATNALASAGTYIVPGGYAGYQIVEITYSQAPVLTAATVPGHRVGTPSTAKLLYNNCNYRASGGVLSGTISMDENVQYCWNGSEVWLQGDISTGCFTIVPYTGVKVHGAVQIVGHGTCQ